jgi:hypothetical protein
MVLLARDAVPMPCAQKENRLPLKSAHGSNAKEKALMFTMVAESVRTASSLVHFPAYEP